MPAKNDFQSLEPGFRNTRPPTYTFDTLDVARAPNVRFSTFLRGMHHTGGNHPFLIPQPRPERSRRLPGTPGSIPAVRMPCPCPAPAPCKVPWLQNEMPCPLGWGANRICKLANTTCAPEGHFSPRSGRKVLCAKRDEESPSHFYSRRLGRQLAQPP